MTKYFKNTFKRLSNFDFAATFAPGFYIYSKVLLFGVQSYFIADWKLWLGDWEHFQPMMQQLPSFLLFCCWDDNSIRTILKPSYVSEYMCGPGSDT